MFQTKVVLAVIIALIVGGALGLFVGRYVYFSDSNPSNSLAQFVLNSPTTPWTADVQGVITELGDASISLQLRVKDGTSKEIYTINLAPQDRFVVDRVEGDSDTTLTTSRINYQDLKVGDEVVVTVSSDGRSESLVVSKIALIPGVTLSQ